MRRLFGTEIFFLTLSIKSIDLLSFDETVLHLRLLDVDSLRCNGELLRVDHSSCVISGEDYPFLTRLRIRRFTILW